MNKESVVAEKIDRPSQNLLPIDFSLSDVDMWIVCPVSESYMHSHFVKCKMLSYSINVEAADKKKKVLM